MAKRGPRSRRIVEVDEAQHFNSFRALTLDHYRADVVTSFDRVVWRQRSAAVTKLRGGGWARPKPPLFPDQGGRHLQRAFRDMLADVLPLSYDWAPTLRIGRFEVEAWLMKADAEERMRALLAEKMSTA